MTTNSSAPHPQTGGLLQRLLTPMPVYGAVYFRIVLSIWTILFTVARLPYLKELYTPAPIMEPSALMSILHVPALPIWFVAVMFVVLLAATVAFAAGVQARAMHVVIVVILAYLMGFDRYAIRGFGELGLYQWVWLFFTPYDRLWDSKGRVVKAQMWGLYLLWAQISIVYLSTFYGKWSAPGHPWLLGPAFYIATHNPAYSVVFLTKWVDIPLPVARVVGFVVLLMEGFVPLAVWHRKTRPIAIAMIILIHLGAAVTMRVTVFFQLLLLSHAPLFLSTQAWERIFVFLGLSTETGERRITKSTSERAPDQ